MDNQRGKYARVMLLLAGVFLLVQNASTESESIVINEIGAYEAVGHEWIELYNPTAETIDLTGWKFIENGANHGLAFIQDSDDDARNDWIVASGAYAVITQNDEHFLADHPTFIGKVFDSSWGTLNEGGEEIGLRDAAGEVVELFTYIPARDFSLERIDGGVADYTEANWIEHEDENTVGEENSNVEAQHAADQENQAEDEIQERVEENGEQNNNEEEDNPVEAEHVAPEENQENDNQDIEQAEEDPQDAAEQEPDNDVEPQHAAAEQENVNNSTKIKINEFVSYPNDGESEWIELFNAGTTTAVMSSWTLHDGVGEIAVVSTTMVSSSFFVIDLPSNKLNNGGDIIILKNNNDDIIDQIAYGNWNENNDEPAVEAQHAAPQNQNNTSAPNQNNSIARIIDGVDTDQAMDWSETVTTTKRFPNQIILNNADANQPPPVEPQHAAPQAEPRSNRGGGGSSIPTYPQYNPGDIIINEFVSDPADGEVEFIELYNPKEQSIDLTDWWIEDGSEAKTQIADQSIAAKDFFVIEKPKGNLNNSGDMIVLYDSHGTEIDSVTYGNFDDGNMPDNAPSAKDPFSVSRNVDGQKSDIDKYDFTVTKAITKGGPNQILTADNQATRRDAACCVSYEGSTDLRINEIFPNPEGSDSENEFVELINVGEDVIDLTGWTLGDASKKRFIIKEGVITPGETKAFFRKETKIALNNGSGDTVKLFSPGTDASSPVETQHAASLLNNTIISTSIDHITYQTAPEQQSFSRRDDGTFDWSNIVTPNETNQIVGKSTAPIISIDADTEGFVGDVLEFDASDSMDPEEDEMTFAWDFDDGKKANTDVVTHQFMQAGVYTVQLSVSDGTGNTSTSKIIVTIQKPQLQVSSVETDQDISKLQITEILPNPEGADTTEFIELYNARNEDIDLSGFYIDDEDGGSKPYAFSEGSIIKAKSYLLLGRQETKVILNNGSDSVRLLDTDKRVLLEIAYDDVHEEASYSFDEETGEWEWTSEMTPGESNHFVPVEDDKKTSRSNNKSTSKSKKKKEKTIINTTIQDIRNQDVGDRVRVQGIVSVVPGVLGSQYMYMNASSSVETNREDEFLSSNGIQVYMYKKDFPDLMRGDGIELVGELSQSGGEYRVKLKEKADILVRSSGNQIEAIPTEIATLGEPYEGTLVQVLGEITEKKSTHLYIDDGTEEIKVYIKKGTNIDMSDIHLGDIVEISGVLSETKSGYRLLPRDQADIYIQESKKEEEIIQPIAPVRASDQERALQYLTATAGGITTLLFGLMTKAHGAWLIQQGKRLIALCLPQKS